MRLYRTIIRIGGVHPSVGRVSGNLPGWDHRRAVQMPENVIEFIDQNNLDTGDYIFVRANIDAEKSDELQISEPFEAGYRIPVEELRAIREHGVNG